MENKERNLEVVQVKGCNFQCKQFRQNIDRLNHHRKNFYKIKETLDKHHYIFLPYTFETKELALKSIEKIKNERR